MYAGRGGSTRPIHQYVFLKLTLELIMVIDKEVFKQQILSGKTIKELQGIYGCGRSTIALYKKEFGFVGITPNSKKRDISSETKICASCNTDKPLSSFYSNGYTPSGVKKYKAHCSTCEGSKRDSKYRELILEYLKSCDKEYSCEKCGYTGIWGSLDFHHVRPIDKLFSIGAPPSKTYSEEMFKEVIEPELDKCMLLCPNCHRQEHLLMGWN